MRLHELEMTAFGPFADTVSVDFGRLSDASVFLLCGDTGAGKTSVLDGVCFAFYGDVPSARGFARQLRSHHAADGVAPRVRLEATVAGRRFRFTRSPAWQRPKRRGTGTTTEPAHVLVEERDGEEWALRTNRLDEAGQLVGDLLGMTLAQFSQVVLLPQGQFDSFLRAGSEDRQKVLTRLFRTDRFEQVERWLAERRLQLSRTDRQHNGAVAAVVHRLSEASGLPAPDRWDLDDLAAPAASGELRDWVDDLLESARRRRDTCSAALDRAAQDRLHATGALAAGQHLAEVLARRDSALATRSALVADADRAAGDRTRLEGARRAAPVVPLAEVAAEAAQARAEAARRSAAALLELATALDTEPEALDTDDLSSRERETTDRLAAARAFLPRAEELREAEQDRAAAVALCERRAADLAESTAQLVALPEARNDVDTELVETRREAEALPVHETARTRTLERLTAATAVTAVAAELVTARAAESAQVAASQELRERWLAIREARLDGMAAELATAMAVGQHCPVCGSTEHPSPASPSKDAPGRDDEQAALRAAEDAQVELEAHRDKVRGLETRLQVAREQAGDRSPEELTEELEALDDALARCRAAAARTATLSASLAGLDEQITSCRAQVAREEEALSAARQRAELLATTVERLSAQLAEILAGEAQRLEDVISGHERLRDLLSAARAAAAEDARSAEHAESADRRLRQAVRAAGFADAATARAAHLAADDVAELERSVSDRTRREEEADAVLADPDVLGASRQACPDLAALQATAEQADRVHTRAAGALQVIDAVAARLQERSRALDEALALWAPAREQYSVVRRLAELVEGKGSDNSRQMRLSAYVLSARLGQVVAAANERLVRMTDGRYVLEHTAERGVGERRGGLSLLVADQWTDERRDPVTLSGGETFVVSLALALGLADVVTAESGGTHIDTLFVDEGFGSLDAETLEQVMDILDQLREGGRAVGVVSHVADMRDRIPTQLRVIKGRSGSSVEHAC